MYHPLSIQGSYRRHLLLLLPLPLLPQLLPLLQPLLLERELYQWAQQQQRQGLLL